MPLEIEGTWMIDPSLGVNANSYLCMQRDGELELVGKKVVDGKAMYRCKWGPKDQESEFHYTWEVRSPRSAPLPRARCPRRPALALNRPRPLHRERVTAHARLISCAAA